MNIHRFNRPLSSRILFVWDGTDKFIQSADRFVRLVENRCVYSVHAMPHESIYSYGNVCSFTKEKPRQALELENEFRRQVSNSKSLRESKFEILFGDRINAIIVMAAQRQAKFIVMPRFEQSTFSKWAHGDLNERIASKAPCPVIFLEAEPNSFPALDVSAGYHQERS